MIIYDDIMLNAEEILVMRNNKGYMYMYTKSF